MRAGPLNTRITVQQLAAGQDALGQPVQTWSDVAMLWADVKQNSGMSMVRGDADVSVVRASIRVRYRTGLTAGMRVLAGSTVYNIQAVLPDVAGRQYIDLVCQVIE